jgi:hypothetical protein
MCWHIFLRRVEQVESRVQLYNVENLLEVYTIVFLSVQKPTSIEFKETVLQTM